MDFLCLSEYKDIFTGHDVRGAELIHLERRDLKVKKREIHAIRDWLNIKARFMLRQQTKVGVFDGMFGGRLNVDGRLNI